MISGQNPGLIRKIGAQIPFLDKYALQGQNRATVLKLQEPMPAIRNVALVATAVSVAGVGFAVVVTLGYINVPGLSSQIVMYVGVAGAGGTFVFGCIAAYQQGKISAFSKRVSADGAYSTYNMPSQHNNSSRAIRQSSSSLLDAED